MSASQHVAVFTSDGGSYKVKDMDEFSNMEVPVTSMPLGASYQVSANPRPTPPPAAFYVADLPCPPAPRRAAAMAQSVDAVLQLTTLERRVDPSAVHAQTEEVQGGANQCVSGGCCIFRPTACNWQPGHQRGLLCATRPSRASGDAHGVWQARPRRTQAANARPETGPPWQGRHGSAPTKAHRGLQPWEAPRHGWSEGREPGLPPDPGRAPPEQGGDLR